MEPGELEISSRASEVARELRMVVGIESQRTKEMDGIVYV
jgi:hypothetical protein